LLTQIYSFHAWAYFRHLCNSQTEIKKKKNGVFNNFPVRLAGKEFREVAVIRGHMVA
jgi:hypothetical protein